MTSLQNYERNQTLDIIKGMVILGVIFVHMRMYVMQGSSNFNPVNDFLYTGLVMFFIISGYCYKERSYKENTTKRFKQLLIAIVVCTIVFTTIVSILVLLYGYNLSLHDYLYTIYETLIGKGAFDPYGSYMGSVSIVEVTYQYYFLWMMLFGFLIFYAIAERATVDWKHVLLYVFVLTSISFLILKFIPVQPPFFLQIAPIAAAFMTIGLYIKKCKVLNYIENEYKSAKYWLIFIVLIALSIVLLFAFPTYRGMYRSIFGAYGAWSVFTFVPVSLVCSFVFLFGAALIGKIPLLPDMLSYIGKHTLAIFLLHIFIAKIITMQFIVLVPDVYLPFTNDIQALSVGIATLIICIICAKAYPKIVERIKGKPRNGESSHR